MSGDETDEVKYYRADSHGEWHRSWHPVWSEGGRVFAVCLLWACIFFSGKIAATVSGWMLN